MTRYKFNPFEVEEQCAHAQRAHYFDRGCDGPCLVLFVDGSMAGLRSNGIPRLIDDEPMTFDILYAKARGVSELTKNLKINIGLEAFKPIFERHPIDIFIDIDNHGTTYSVGATIPKEDSGPFSMSSRVRDDDMAPG